MLKQALTGFLAPAPHRPRLPDEEVRQLYPRYRFAILEATFLGYATAYLVRNNLAAVSRDMEGALGYTASMTGAILTVTALSYGVSKFLMGSVSDRSNPRRFMPLGLLLTACLNFAFGSVHSYSWHLVLWALNGFAQGMMWPPCGRSIGHWFSVSERGSIFAVWNVAHNVGGGLAGIIAAWAAARWGWEAAFYFPGLLALVGAGYLAWRLRDTPQSVGLPPVEVYRNDFPPGTQETREQELGTRELFVRYILYNRYLWLFAVANFFVYVVRYSMLDWGPYYIRTVKHATILDGGVAVLALEFGGIPSTLLMGWISDRIGGRRGMVSLLCMVPILLAFVGIHLNPPGNLWLDTTLLGVVGFFVYPPVMLLGVSALDLTSKKAVGTAAGFIGMFGYLGRAAQATGLGWLADNCGWDSVMYAIYLATGAAIVLLAFSWRIRPRA